MWLNFIMKIKIKKLNEDAIIPHYVHEGDAGMDIYSVEDVVIESKKRVVVSTGISIELPRGYVSLIWDKSGLAAKHGIKTMAGVCDAGYRGEYKIVLLNTSEESYEIKKGDKIAQILIQKIENPEIEKVKELEETKRGEGGFGSTGISNNS